MSTSPPERLAHVLDALEAEGGVAVARGRALLARAIGWMGSTAWPETAWSFSELADGAPVELIWRPGRPGLFWTAEPAAPEWPAGRRMARALTLARRCDPAFAGAPLADAHHLARGNCGPLWIAGRHEASGDTAKLYRVMDWQALAPDVVRRALRDGDQPVMLGLAANGGREWYWRRPARAGGDHYRLARMGLAEAAGRLDTMLAKWTGAGLDDDVERRLGLSIATDPSGEPRALAAFLRVSSAGGAASVRERLLAAGGASNPALADCWASGTLRPMLLTLAATTDADLPPAIGLTLELGRRDSTGSAKAKKAE